jgi:hypothetical protein
MRGIDATDDMFNLVFKANSAAATSSTSSRVVYSLASVASGASAGASSLRRLSITGVKPVLARLFSK